MNKVIHSLKHAAHYASEVGLRYNIRITIRVTEIGIGIEGLRAAILDDGTDGIKSSTRTVSWESLSSCQVNPLLVEMRHVVDELRPAEGDEE